MMTIQTTGTPAAGSARSEAGLSAFDKGIPGHVRDLPLNEVAAQGWDVLAEDLPLPVAIIRREALRSNSAWMRRFVNAASADIAPHGKTTMSPALFDLQLADGAWAITLSTPHQLQVARRFGYPRIFFANQLIGRAAIDYVVGQLRDDPGFDFYCLVDSLANVASLAEAARRHGLARPMTVLVEIGYPGGRTGCRDVATALAVARAVRRTDGALALAGVEGFEGLIRGGSNDDTLGAVERFLDTLVDLARRCEGEGLFGSEPVLLSAGGSAHYDVVARRLGGAGLSRPTRVLLRSGCYITHDAGLYTRAVDALRERDPELAGAHGGLKAALEVWAYVQSRPEPGKAIIGFGKRDSSHDDPPVALSWFRPGGGMPAPLPVPPDHVVTRLNDQHCHLSIPPDSPLQVGDMVGFGISHPCLTFDKWRVIHLVDEGYRVVETLRTYF